MMSRHDWDEFQRQCFKTAQDHGFHDNDSDEPGIMGLQFQQRLMLVTSEVVEAHDYARKGAAFSDVWWTDGKPHGIPYELADIVIRVADLCESYGISLGLAIDEKMRFNEHREQMHGKNRF